MSRLAVRPLSFTSYIVLALVGRHGAGVHDIARSIQQGGQLYGGVALSQVYAEAKRLHDSGHLTARVEPGLTTSRTVYSMTELGRTALVHWLRGPSPFPTLRQEVTLRLLAGDLLTDAEIVASVTAMRTEIDRIEALVDEMVEGATRLPHRHRTLMLQHDLGRRLIAAYRDWVDEVEHKLG
jgi:DNA-binding PadR family transcriptional regulator